MNPDLRFRLCELLALPTDSSDSYVFVSIVRLQGDFLDLERFVDNLRFQLDEHEAMRT